MLYQGDNLTIMPNLADKSIDLTVTSPPYDNLRTYNGNLAFDFEGIAKELYRVTKDGGVVIWVVGDATKDGNETGTSFRQVLYFQEIGFNLHDTMIYTRMQIKFNRFGHKKYPNAFDYMFVFVKGKIKTFNPIFDSANITKGKMSPTVRQKDGSLEKSYSFGREYKETGIRNNVWNYFTGGNNSTKDKIAFQHPAIFPEKLAMDHILSWSNEGDLVLDPFAGSGTTGVACLNTGRKFILIEKDATYCEIIRKRIENHMPLLQAINE